MIIKAQKSFIVMKTLEEIPQQNAFRQIKVAWLQVRNSKGGQYFSLYLPQMRAVKLVTIHCDAEMSIVCEHIYLAD